MHSMGRITDWQLDKARPREGTPRSPETRADERG
jgi:hypothetical protein